MTPTAIFGLALFIYALTRMPDKYKPTWTHHLNSWKALIGLVAVIAAILIVMNPEFYALGILGDSTFFDILVLAISLQLQGVLFRIWHHVVAGFSKTKQFIGLRIFVTCSMMIFVFTDAISVIQRVVHRISSI
jgi:hypothetical protein